MSSLVHLCKSGLLHHFQRTERFFSRLRDDVDYLMPALINLGFRLSVLELVEI